MGKNKFVLKSKSAKQATEKQTTKKTGITLFKPEATTTRLLILPNVTRDEESDDAITFETLIHEIWVNQRPIAKAASPEFDGEEDKITKIGWTLRDRFKEDDNDAKKEFFKKWLPNKSLYCNVLDLDDIDAGPQVYRMSGSVVECVVDELKDLLEQSEDDEIDFTSICDFDEGRILQVRHNGKKGKNRRYKAKFLPETAQLVEDGTLDEAAMDEIADKMYDLKKLQPIFDEEAFEKVYEILLKSAKKLGIDVDDDDTGFDEDGENDEIVEDGEDELSENDMDFSEDEEEIEEEVEEKKEPVKKKTAKKTASKATKKTVKKTAEVKKKTRRRR